MILKQDICKYQQVNQRESQSIDRHHLCERQKGAWFYKAVFLPVILGVCLLCACGKKEQETENYITFTV